MTDLTPNVPPEGESCGTCRFAGTHTHRKGRDRTTILCKRYPPQRLGRDGRGPTAPTESQMIDTAWPMTTWDDWCGEWVARDEPETKAATLGFGR